MSQAPASSLRKTALNEVHERIGGRMVSFAGWELPLHYGSQIEEHIAVRTRAGLFDVSHMGIVDISGSRAVEFMRYLLANDIARLSGPGGALYSCMLNESAGIIDDVIAYWMDVERFRLVVNAAMREQDVTWISEQGRQFGVLVRERDGLSMVAVQGPLARNLAVQSLPWLGASVLDLNPMEMWSAGAYQCARTGYTGEDGFEMIIPDAGAVDAWMALMDAGAAACGLGARDSLRLEAGMRLRGTDMDESTTPFDVGLGWTVALDDKDRDFVGRTNLLARSNCHTRFVGVILQEPGVLRSGLRLELEDSSRGLLTSGGYSPSLERSVGLARIPGSSTSVEAYVEIRGRRKPCRLVKPRFIRHGRPVIDP